ncbi:MAG TPA: hypothetical protein VFI79_10630 [Gemmatimonadales bacterium]|nr:hypothetical protein [Gemmatimonadales bacterium]
MIRTAQVKRAAAPLPMPRVLRDATTTPDVVTVPTRTVLTLDGEGAPEGQTFQNSVAAIYGVAYALKFGRKNAGRGDFKIGPLEARWWTDHPPRRLPDVPRESWCWQLRMAMPQDVSRAELARTVETATQKKGGRLAGNPETRRVTLTALPAARCGRVLHIGPYADEGASLGRVAAAVKEALLTPGLAHVEVYLSDPRRTKPEALKTVLLLEVA